MTRYKKIQEEKQITALIYHFIEQRGGFYYRYDLHNLSFMIYLTTKVPQHRIRRYFYKNVLPNRAWLMKFEY